MKSETVQKRGEVREDPSLFPTPLVHSHQVLKVKVSPGMGFYFFRTEGGIPPLVMLLDSADPKVQRAGAGALRTLAFKNELNKNQVQPLPPHTRF